MPGPPALFAVPTATDLRRGLASLIFGLVLFGIGIAFMISAQLGQGSWDVFHQGVADKVGLSIGTVTSLTGLILVLAFIPLRERVGLGTILNVAVIGPVVDVTLAVLGDPESMPLRIALMLGGPAVIGLGSGFYIGAGLGPGPRDGIMTRLAKRGIPVWVARTGIELTVLAIGFMLGGTAGLGTIWFAVSIGPFVQFFLRRLDRSEAVEPR